MKEMKDDLYLVIDDKNKIQERKLQNNLIEKQQAIDELKDHNSRNGTLLKRMEALNKKSDERIKKA